MNGQNTSVNLNIISIPPNPNGAKKHKRSITGTGLGWSIAMKIMDLHGCEYGILSELDKGSPFWFSVPLY